MFLFVRGGLYPFNKVIDMHMQLRNGEESVVSGHTLDGQESSVSHVRAAFLTTRARQVVATHLRSQLPQRIGLLPHPSGHATQETQTQHNSCRETVLSVHCPWQTCSTTDL